MIIDKKQYQKNYEAVKPGSSIVEEKGKFTYLSWGYAEKFLKENHPQIMNNIRMDYIDKGLVGCELVNKETNIVEHVEWLAITDFKNIAIKLEFLKQTDIALHYQRAFAKAVARFTGYGMALYLKEEYVILEERLKKAEKEGKPVPQIINPIIAEIGVLVKYNLHLKDVGVEFIKSKNKKSSKELTDSEQKELLMILRKTKELDNGK